MPTYTIQLLYSCSFLWLESLHTKCLIITRCGLRGVPISTSSLSRGLVFTGFNLYIRHSHAVLASRGSNLSVSLSVILTRFGFAGFQSLSLSQLKYPQISPILLEGFY